MVFIGYILPPKNKRLLDNEISLNVINAKNDILAYARKLEIDSFYQSPENISVSTQTGISSTQTGISSTQTTEIPVSSSVSVVIPVKTKPRLDLVEMSPISDLTPFGLALKSKELNWIKNNPGKSLTDDIRKILLKQVEDEGESSKSVMKSISASSSRSNSPESKLLQPSSSEPNPDIYNLMNLFYDDKGEFDFSKTDKIDTFLNKLDDKTLRSIIVNTINNGNIIYGARRKNQVNILDTNKLGKDVNNNLLFINDGSSLNKNNLALTLRMNIQYLNSVNSSSKTPKSPILETVSGEGIKNKYKDKVFGQYTISPTSYSKNNLVLYQGKNVILKFNDMKPKLKKIVNEIRNRRTFNINEYNKLDYKEKILIDKIIMLLKIRPPTGLISSLEHDNSKLKDRYTTLIGIINAGNGGLLIMRELKEVLKKLLNNKYISRTKYTQIINALIN